jgi:hypothetical protein
MGWSVGRQQCVPSEPARPTANARRPHPTMTRRPLLAPSRLAGFDWPTGAARPRYMRYKSLTSARQEGTCRFGPKDWVGLPDGEYLFSIDTGSVESGADSSDRPPALSSVTVMSQAHSTS